MDCTNNRYVEHKKNKYKTKKQTNITFIHICVTVKTVEKVKKKNVSDKNVFV